MFNQKFEEAKALLVKGEIDDSLTLFCDALKDAYLIYIELKP